MILHTIIYIIYIFFEICFLSFQNINPNLGCIFTLLLAFLNKLKNGKSCKTGMLQH